MSTDEADTGVTEPAATRLEDQEEPGAAPRGRRFARPAQTRLEPAATSGSSTRLESAGNGAGATRLEGGGAEPGFTRVNLPPPLLERFTPLRDIATRGAEADLLLVRDATVDEPRVLKLYRSAGDRIDRKMLGLVRQADGAHVVRLHDTGSWNGIWWELLEYCELGSLADLIRDEGPKLDAELARAIVDEVAIALEHIHSLPCVHRDIKPANILVRTREPLDLVLADFGLATVIGATKEMRSASRTVEYSAPEAAWGVVAPARDWWALGIMLVEVLTGRHPFVGSDGTPLEQRQIDAALATRSIDLTGVEDDRFRLLCSGLLVRDPDKRWGAAQVNEWRDGGSPPVAADSGATQSRRRVMPFEFRDPVSGETTQFRDPVALATALAGDWERALKVFSTKKDDRRTTIAFRRFADSLGDEELRRILDDDKDPDAEAKLVRVLVTLDPAIPPTFRGYAIDRAGLAAIASRGEAHADLIRALGELDILRIYSSAGDEVADLAVCESDWHAVHAYVDRTLRNHSTRLPSGTNIDQLVTRATETALGAVADEGFAAEVAAEAERLGADELATSQHWFADLIGGRGQTASSIGHDIVVTLLGKVAHDAGEQQRRQREAAERKRREERSARFWSALRTEIRAALLIALGLFCGCFLAALGFTFAISGGGSEVGPAVPVAGVAAAIGAGGIYLAGFLFNVWVYRRGTDNEDYWHRLPPGLFWFGVIAAPMLAIGLLVATTHGYVPPDAWPIVGIIAAAVPAWLLLLRVARAESGIDGRWRAAVLLALIVAVAAPLAAKYGASRTAVKDDFAAASKKFAKAAPFKGCRPLPYDASPRRDWVRGGARCSDSGYQAKFLWIDEGWALDRYAEARKDGADLTHEKNGNCQVGRAEVRKWIAVKRGVRSTGQVLCYHAKGGNHLEWSNNGLAVYGSVWRHDRQGRRIYAWWLAHRVQFGRPVSHGRKR